VVLNIDVSQPAIWWQVIPVLVLNASDWPTADGSSGITSVAKMRAAEKVGDALQAPSNFYLFFASYPAQHWHWGNFFAFEPCRHCILCAAQCCCQLVCHHRNWRQRFEPADASAPVHYLQ